MQNSEHYRLWVGKCIPLISAYLLLSGGFCVVTEVLLSQACTKCTPLDKSFTHTLLNAHACIST